MNVKVEAEIRETHKKSDIKNLRKNGFIPAILYGEGKEGKKLSFEKISFLKSYKTKIGETSIYNIEVGKDKFTAFIKDIQIHPLTREFIHIDFVEIQAGKEITLDIPIKIVGDKAISDKGGILDVIFRKIEVTCLPKHLPENIELDVSQLGIGDTLSVADLKVENLKINASEDTTLVTVIAPLSEEELAAELGLVSEEEEVLEGERETTEEKADEGSEETDQDEETEESKKD